MESPADRARARLIAYRSAQARARLEAATHGPEAIEGGATGRQLARGRRRLAERETLEAIDEAERLGLLEAGEPGALRLHAARAAADDVGEPARARGRRWGDRSLDAVDPPRPTARGAMDALLDAAGAGARTEPLLGGLAAVGDELAPELEAARASADDAAGTVARHLRDTASGRGGEGAIPSPVPSPGGLLLLMPEPPPEPGPAAASAGDDGARPDPLAHPDRGPPAADLREKARAFLEATAGMVPRADTLGARLTAWRAGPLDGLVPRRSRPRRVAADLATPQGFDRVLSEAVRFASEAGPAPFDPRCRVLGEDVPGRVHVVASARELGVGSELLLAEALGRALALATTSPGVPAALAHPVAGTVGRALGAAAAQLVADRAHLRRVRGLDEASAEALARAAAGWLLLAARGWAAATLLRGFPRAERPEVAGGLASEAWGVPVPDGLARVLLAAPAGPAARFRGLVGGLSVAWALREHLDEDWARNPRTADVLRAATSRGGGLSVEGWLDELGGRWDDGARRLGELTG